MQQIPDGEQAREVAVRIVDRGRMMYAVHPRRYKKPQESPLDGDGQFHVAVVKNHSAACQQRR